MEKNERVWRVKEYVRRRLRAQIAAGPRGAQADAARALGISTAHIANLLSEPPSRNPGEPVCRKAAELWGISYEELERKACGDAPPAPASAPAGPDLDALRKMLDESVAAALAARDKPKRRRRG